MDTLENLRRKIGSAKQLKSVVRTMKAMAASNIGQYEMAVSSLGDYYRTIVLGIVASFMEEKIQTTNERELTGRKDGHPIGAIVFGSDQGLVGQFNDRLLDFVMQSFRAMPGKKEVWAVGERIGWLLSDAGLPPARHFNVPNSVSAITPLVGQILTQAEESHERNLIREFHIFHNQPRSQAAYEPVKKRLLPLDEEWRRGLTESRWPTSKIPEVVGGVQMTIRALIHEYLFISLFKSCAESLASENASRLAAMQRAEKNIEELLDELSHRFHRLRQESIDEELFDVVSGFEALKK